MKITKFTILNPVWERHHIKHYLSEAEVEIDNDILYLQITSQPEEIKKMGISEQSMLRRWISNELKLGIMKGIENRLFGKEEK